MCSRKLLADRAGDSRRWYGNVVGHVGASVEEGAAFAIAASPGEACVAAVGIAARSVTAIGRDAERAAEAAGAAGAARAAGRRIGVEGTVQDVSAGCDVVNRAAPAVAAGSAVAASSAVGVAAGCVPRLREDGDKTAESSEPPLPPAPPTALSLVNRLSLITSPNAELKSPPPLPSPPPPPDPPGPALRAAEGEPERYISHVDDRARTAEAAGPSGTAGRRVARQGAGYDQGTASRVVDRSARAVTADPAVAACPADPAAERDADEAGDETYRCRRPPPPPPVAALPAQLAQLDEQDSHPVLNRKPPSPSPPSLPSPPDPPTAITKGVPSSCRSRSPPPAPPPPPVAVFPVAPVTARIWRLSPML